MAATRSTADLVLRAAELMNHVRPGADVSDRARSTITKIYQNDLAELVDKNAAYWSENEIPSAVFERLAMRIAVKSASSFGALPIVLAAIGVSNGREADEYTLHQLRLHVEREPQYNQIKTSIADWM